MLPNDNVSMSVGHLGHVLIVYSSMEHVTWESPGPMCGWVGRILHPDSCTSVSSWSSVSFIHLVCRCASLSTRWFPGHVLHRAVNNQDVIKMSDGMNLFNTGLICHSVNKNAILLITTAHQRCLTSFAICDKRIPEWLSFHIVVYKIEVWFCWEATCLVWSPVLCRSSSVLLRTRGVLESKSRQQLDRYLAALLFV